MKTTKNPAPALSLVALLTALLAACSSTPVATPAPAAPPLPTVSPATQPSPQAGTARSTPSSKVTTVTLPAYLDPKSNIASDRSVFFDFDMTLVKPEFTDLVERHGKYLAGNPKLSIKVEGNTDERGSAEYNLALGNKRAQAVVQALKIYGAKDSQLEAVSWGRERPRMTGHDEAAWAQNRRADLQYPSR